MADPQAFERVQQLNNRVELPQAAERAPSADVQRNQEVAAPRPVQRVPVAVAAPSATPAKSSAPKSETLQGIERIMESDLRDVYKQMPPDLQQAFRRRGEDTAVQIDVLLRKVKVQTKKIFQLLFTWLKIIPGVNKYFLEQEAKIKTDELMRLKSDLDKKQGRSTSI